MNCFRDRHWTLSEGGTEIAPPVSIVDPEGTVRSLVQKIDPEPSVALGFPCGGPDDSRGALREIRGAERGHEPVQFSMPFDAPEALRGALYLGVLVF